MDDTGIFCRFRERQPTAIFFRVAAGDSDDIDDVPGVIVAALINHLKPLFLQQTFDTHRCGPPPVAERAFDVMHLLQEWCDEDDFVIA